MHWKQIHKNLVYSQLAPESNGLFLTSKNKNTSPIYYLLPTGRAERHRRWWGFAGAGVRGTSGSLNLWVMS